ncbi:hypothetical protein I5Q34_16350 [Streptomyces sp. AV19]|uniref:hypothetical protein n=1 Tax=Streptomyces sp. AV19 TaxID=2793068 RepID=UPI0018FE1A23|nr:hypothetical protein [Streptomyces sp. AV19]MBH1935820.1 hypothetical protein [Streptomyces sp. AV19]MDG4534037.1 hypothetical protein [Streptomyces sp. AV19]
MAIQPSFGNPAAKRHWHDTLDQEVPFVSEPHTPALTEAERSLLLQAHPSGHARFWGATAVQDKNMDRLRTGDVVLFTGGKQVRGIGEIGITLRNAGFADTMWTPDPNKGSWHNVYSLLSFQPTEIPYAEIWALPSFNTGDNFMGLRILEGEKADEILQGLGIDTFSSAQQEIARDIEVATAIAKGTQIVPIEGLHTTTATYHRDARQIHVNRAEALLQTEYIDTLNGLITERLRTPAGVTDIHVTGPDGTEIIEAKRSADHGYVRAALAQLLDYAPHSPQPADRLSGLFPSRPADPDIALLHRYGIDCLYRSAPGVFERVEAPTAVREHMRQVWTKV